MGFALPAHLPLERYIGSCLISPCPPPPPQFSPPPLQPRKFQRQFYNSKTLLRNANGPPPPDRAAYPPNRSLKANQRHGLFEEPEGVWTIGVPLLAVQPFVKSKNSRTTKKNRKYGGDTPQPDASLPPRMLHNRSQFSKLAVHTQGVPLIQSSRYEQSCKSKSGKAGNPSSRNAPLDANKIASGRKDSAGSSGKTGESSSVSDENLSCNSLENSLPRIIKPRKRRKKDRKPNGVPSAAPDDNNNTPKEDDSGKEATKKDGGQPDGGEKAPEDKCAPESGNPDDAAGKENESAEKGISCRCRYCDPSSVIWNVNTRGYSPSLVSCILPLGAEHQHRSSGPVSLRGPGPPTPDSHAKFPPLEAKTKMPPNDCRFPPPNFHRPPNPFPYRGSPPYHNPIPMSSPSDRGGFAELELYAAGKIGFPAPEQKLPEFTQRFGLLNVSSFHVPTGFIDTSRRRPRSRPRSRSPRRGSPTTPRSCPTGGPGTGTTPTAWPSGRTRRSSTKVPSSRARRIRAPSRRAPGPSSTRSTAWWSARPPGRRRRRSSTKAPVRWGRPRRGRRTWRCPRRSSHRPTDTGTSRSSSS
ncbi:uncharacterized protein [Bemisia tabaci]|uniref:uncharacterized protein n=1 Tax=Bemisia tabaci TaxID=7038 RepID=UPI003B27CFA8